MSTAAERFVLKDLPDNAWSVSWPGYEYVVVDNPAKADNLLKILFDEVGVEEAVMSVQQYNQPDKTGTMRISWISWHQNNHNAACYVTRHHIVTGCKFVDLKQAEQFKLAMEQRLAWNRLGGKWK